MNLRMRFDWRTEEEAEWQHEEPDLPARDRRFRFVLTVAALAIVTAIALLRFGELQAEAIRESAREEVAAANDLLLHAAGKRDEELLNSLWGGGEAWRAERQLMLDSGLIFDRRTAALDRQPGQTLQREVSLAPGLRQALVTVTLSYTGFVRHTGLQPVSLRYPMRYEKREARWLWVPYGDAYWDSWVTEDRDGLEVIYPARDAALATRLANDLREPLRRICGAVADCPQRQKMTLRFTRDRETLLSPLVEDSTDAGRLMISVPTPTVMGTPEQEAGYQALPGAYLRLLARALLAYEPQQEGPNHLQFQAGVLQRLLWELGATGWPPNVPLPPQTGAESGVNEDVWAFCVAGADEASTLYRYRTVPGSWEGVLQLADITAMASPGAVDGILLQRRPAASSGFGPQILYWSGERQVAVLPDLWLDSVGDNQPVVRALDLHGREVALWFGDGSGCSSARCELPRVSGHGVTWSPGGDFTLARRQPEGSRSPPASDDMLFLTDRRGNVLSHLKHGYSAFWLDDTTYGFVQTPLEPAAEGGDYAVVTGDVESANPRLLVSAGALRSRLPANARGRRIRFFIRDVVFHPAHPQTLFLFASSFRPPSLAAPDDRLFLFAIDRHTGEPELKLSLSGLRAGGAPGISASGRWLSFYGASSGKEGGVVYLYDLQAQALTAVNLPSGPLFEGLVPILDWSDGADRLLVADGGRLRVISPDSGEEQILVPPHPGCTYAAWAGS